MKNIISYIGHFHWPGVLDEEKNNRWIFAMCISSKHSIRFRIWSIMSILSLSVRFEFDINLSVNMVNHDLTKRIFHTVLLLKPQCITNYVLTSAWNVKCICVVKFQFVTLRKFQHLFEAVHVSWNIMQIFNVMLFYVYVIFHIRCFAEEGIILSCQRADR